MAGRPKRRAELALQSAGGGVETLEPAPTRAPAGAQSAREPEHTSARERVPEPSPVATGPLTLSALDTTESRRVLTLQDAVEPCSTLRITRTRPHWAEGYLEHYELEEGEGYEELLDYLRDEWGGTVYRIDVMSRDRRRVLFTGKEKIGGPVKREGKACTREQWESGSDAKPARLVVSNPQPTAAAAQPFGGMDPLALFDRFQGMAEKIAAANSDAIKQLSTSQQAVVKELMTRVGNGAPTQQGSILEQMREFANTATAIDQVREQLAPPEKPNNAAADESLGNQIMKEVIKEGVLQEMRGRQPQPTPQRQQVAAQQQQRAATQQQQPTQQRVASQPSAASSNGVESLQ